MSTPKIGIVIGTTRAGRFGDKPADWIFGLGAAREDLALEIVDLRDYPLPLFDGAKAPIHEPSGNEVAQRFGAKLAELDGYIFITAEYNHGPAGALKNAIDFVYHEMGRKPAAFVGYGGTGGARAVEQLRLILVEFRVAPLRDAVHIGLEPLLAVRQGKMLSEFEFLNQSAETMLDELAWWTRTLNAGRVNR
jgi:NAD(P)H-dependent FMN reductase